MFTGIIEETGRIERLTWQGDAMVLAVSCGKVLDGVKVGDSLSVDGVCLTVTDLDSTVFTADVMVETMKRTNLVSAQSGSLVNLERALAAGERLGGHFVTGHVDATATITERQEIANAVLFRFLVSPEWTAFMVPKGSIAVNGISLTIIDVDDHSFSVSVIPHTLQMTNLGRLNVGDEVNIECDMLGKYVVRLFEQRAQTSKQRPGMSFEFLKQNGFA